MAATMITLIDTQSSAIAAAFTKSRMAAGSPAMGMVMTLIIVVDEEDASVALDAARAASIEHPARVLAVILGDLRRRSQVDAEVGIGNGWTGETALIRLRGEVARHPDSVVRPLLLSDSPVAIWWPTDHPENPSTDPLGNLAQRRITDAAHVHHQKRDAILTQARVYTPGNTDLSWTRITPWRALLAAALDSPHAPLKSASVVAEAASPSADLLAAWLSDRLQVSVSRGDSGGPGITSVSLGTTKGPIAINRTDGVLATYSSPGQPDRLVALRRRGIEELLTEELRRLDEDNVYAETVQELLRLSDA
jgi:glucose-6-phosphate dehydrogenase assembly protein OpcA